MDAQTWDALIGSLQDPHILQTWEWGRVKMQNDWHPIPIVWYDGIQEYVEAGEIQSRGLTSKSPRAAALVLERIVRISGFSPGLRVMYIPKGPLLMDWGNKEERRWVLNGLEDFVKHRGAIFLKIDPDVRLGSGIPGSTGSYDHSLGEEVEADLKALGWCYSSEQIQFRNTVIIDLSLSEEELSANMKQKTRYNVRLATRKGVTVRPGTEADLGILYRMYAETAYRDGFSIRDESYYIFTWGRFLTQGMADLLIAEVNAEPVAGLIMLRFAGKAWYMYGMSRQTHREKMPNYLLQWEAMLRAKATGCTMYDLWGAPDRFDQNDPMWGVYRFKEGLGGGVVRHIGAWDLPVRPVLYQLYKRVLPLVLEIMRNRGRTRVRESIKA